MRTGRREKAAIVVQEEQEVILSSEDNEGSLQGKRGAASRVWVLPGRVVPREEPGEAGGQVWGERNLEWSTSSDPPPPLGQW